jgi:nucleotide-binding universal stress UspA family protein
MTAFRKILVPYDFSDPARRALELAADMLPPRGRLLVLHVIVPFVPVTDLTVGAAGYVAPQEFVGETTQHLERVVAKTIGRRRLRVDTKVVIGDPYTRIVAAARGMDAIVMSTAGRTGLSHLLIGSVAEKVIRHSPIPVLALPARAAGKRRSRRR